MNIICDGVGKPGTRMWTLGKSYSASMTGFGDSLLEVNDDLGITRAINNEPNPKFPMGTDVIFGKTLYARFRLDATQFED